MMLGGPLAQVGQKFDSGHHRHVPIQQHHIGHRRIARVQRQLAVFRFVHVKAQGFEDMSRNLADYAGIIDDEARFHGDSCV